MVEITSSDKDSAPNFTADDRRVTSRMGRGFAPGQGVRCVATRVPSPLHQLAGTSSNLPLPGTLPLLPEGRTGVNHDRQHHSSGVYQEPGDIEVNDFIGFVEEDLRILPGRGYNPSSQTSTRQSQRPSGSGIETESGFHRVDVRLRNVQFHLDQIRPFRVRPVCQQVQRSIRQFCITLSRQLGIGYQCLKNSMGQMGVNLSISSDPVAERSSGSPNVVPRERGAYCTLVRSGNVVSQFAEQGPGTRAAASFFNPVPRNIPRQGVPPEPITLPASRVETIRLGLSRKGYSRNSIDRIIGAQRPSTRKQYQSAWKCFLNYLAAQRIPHSI